MKAYSIFSDFREDNQFVESFLSELFTSYFFVKTDVFLSFYTKKECLSEEFVEIEYLNRGVFFIPFSLINDSQNEKEKYYSLILFAKSLRKIYQNEVKINNIAKSLPKYYEILLSYGIKKKRVPIFFELKDFSQTGFGVLESKSPAIYPSYLSLEILAENLTPGLNKKEEPSYYLALGSKIICKVKLENGQIEILKEIVMETNEKVNLTVCLGELEITSEEFFSLRPGTKIEFDRDSEFEGTIKVGKNDWAKAVIKIEEDSVLVEVGEISEK